MKTHLSYVALLLISLTGGAGVSLPVSADQMLATESALVRVVEEPGWNMGARLHFDRRQYDTDAARVDTDIRQLVARLGIRLAPSLHVWGDLGAAEADVESNRGGAGLVWGIGAGLSVFEYAMQASPVVGSKELLSLEIEGSYRDAESDFNEDRTLTWQDARVATIIAYRINSLGEQEQRPFDPSGYALRAGPVYTRVSGEFDGTDFEHTNEFGALFGADIRMNSGWLVRAEFIWLGRDNREFSLGAHRYF